jgi:hypothetical protein
MLVKQIFTITRDISIYIPKLYKLVWDMITYKLFISITGLLFIIYVWTFILYSYIFILILYKNPVDFVNYNLSVSTSDLEGLTNYIGKKIKDQSTHA